MMVVIFCLQIFLALFMIVSGATKKQPNIIFVLVDDLGYHDTGYHNDFIYSPNIDKLAEKGVKLTNYYVQPLCTPSRSQLLSGRYQIHTGMQHLAFSIKSPAGLPLDSPTLADKLREAGYATHMVGKWHLGSARQQYLPQNRGFDTFFGYLGPNEDHFNHTSKYNGVSYLDLRDENGPVWSEFGHYSAHMYTQKAIQVVNMYNKASNKPFFLYLAHQSVHDPIQVPDHYTTRYNITDTRRRKFAGMVSALDEGIGNLTEALYKNSLWENTVFIFSTDNGGKFIGGGNNFPLRGEKFDLWEGGIRAIGFVIAPGIKPRTYNYELIHVSDWFPTLVGLAGGQLNGTKPLDGYDQWGTIMNSTSSPRTVLLHNIDPMHPLKGKRQYNNTFDTRVRAAIRVRDMKLLTGDPGPSIWFQPPEKQGSNKTAASEEVEKNVWLFNITADPLEKHDLSDQRPETVMTILRMLDNINKTSVPVYFPPADTRSNPALHGGVWGPWLP